MVQLDETQWYQRETAAHAAPCSGGVIHLSRSNSLLRGGVIGINLSWVRDWSSVPLYYIQPGISSRGLCGEGMLLSSVFLHCLSVGLVFVCALLQCLFCLFCACLPFLDLLLLVFSPYSKQPHVIYAPPSAILFRARA